MRNIRRAAAAAAVLAALSLPAAASAEVLLCRGGISRGMLGINVRSRQSATSLEAVFLFYFRTGGTGGQSDLRPGECTFPDRGLDDGDYGMVVQSTMGNAVDDVAFYTSLEADTWVIGGRIVRSAMTWLPWDKNTTAGSILDPDAYFQFTVVRDDARRLYVIQSPNATPCPDPVTVSGGQSGNFDTTGPVCLRTVDGISGWGCSNFDGRTVSVNGTAVSCGQFPLPARWPDGYTYFSISGGTFAWASMYWW